jgi:hypothetical protein
MNNRENFKVIVSKIRPKEIPLWEDCQWKRDACNKDSCPFCGKINKLTESRLKTVENKKENKANFEELGKTFDDVVNLFRSDAKRLGIDLDAGTFDESIPFPEDYSICRKLINWQQGIYDIASESDDIFDIWLHSDAGKNLLWYSNTIISKTYRQLLSIDRMRTEKNLTLKLDFKYTAYILNEVIKIIDDSLEKLSQSKTGGNHSVKFKIAQICFRKIRDDIKK